MRTTLQETKVMAWAAIVNGRDLPIFWFPKGVSVNDDNYLDLLKNNLMPELHSEELEEFFFQQDGAPPHCAAQCLEFLEEIFL